jgi:hypothetical protein
METEPSLGDGEAVDTQLPAQDASMQTLCSLIRFVLICYRCIFWSRRTAPSFTAHRPVRHHGCAVAVELRCH